MANEAPKNQVRAIFLFESFEGHPFSGQRTINQEKFPGVIIIRTPIGIEAEHKGNVAFIPYSNIKNVWVK